MNTLDTYKPLSYPSMVDQRRRTKNITFLSNIDYDDEVQNEMDTDERILDAIVLLGR